MPDFDPNSFQDVLAQYLVDNCVLEIVSYSYYDDPNGYNFDVGERKEFDLKLTNNGSLGMNNVYLKVTAEHGALSQSKTGLPSTVSDWFDWKTPSITVRPFNLPAHSSFTLKHEVAGQLFAFRADETTGGADNDRDTEVILTARIANWEPDLSMVLKVADSPEGTWSSFIQRS